MMFHYRAKFGFCQIGSVYQKDKALVYYFLAFQNFFAKLVYHQYKWRNDEKKA